MLPPLDRFLIDVGPSYVVVSAIVVALLFGTWLARAAAAADLAVLSRLRPHLRRAEPARLRASGI